MKGQGSRRLQEGGNGDAGNPQHHRVLQRGGPDQPLTLDLAVGVDVDSALGVAYAHRRIVGARVPVGADGRGEYQPASRVDALHRGDYVPRAAHVHPERKVAVPLAARRQQRGQVQHCAGAVDSVPYAVRIRNVAARYLDILPALQPGKIHRRQVEDPDRLARRREHLDKLPPDAARSSGDEHRSAHVRVVPFIPAFSMTSWALVISFVSAGPNPIPVGLALQAEQRIGVSHRRAGWRHRRHRLEEEGPTDLIELLDDLDHRGLPRPGRGPPSRPLSAGRSLCSVRASPVLTVASFDCPPDPCVQTGRSETCPLCPTSTELARATGGARA